LIAFTKRHGTNAVIVVVCLNHHHVEEGLVDVRADVGIPEAFQVQDLLDGQRYDWHWGGNFVRLGPGERMAHVFRVVGP
ncbi:MAG TPA: hypothetical protein VE570_11420, partial [Thermoleophilaceae bacterium]|nr:hypothetical protein [Thermoleophilaceae bacterium]